MFSLWKILAKFWPQKIKRNILSKNPCLCKQKFAKLLRKKKYLGSCLHILIQFLFLGHFFVSFLPFWKISIFMLPIIAKYCLGWIANDTLSENRKRREKRKTKHPYILIYIDSIQGTREYYTYLLGWVYGTLYIHPNPKVTFGHSC